jgi:hypothetical protein
MGLFTERGVMNFEFAPQYSVEMYEDIARVFFPKIFGMDYADVMITDESSVYDFDFELTEDKVDHQTSDILNKIKSEYNLDVSDAEDLLLVKIFERIRILSP